MTDKKELLNDKEVTGQSTPISSTCTKDQTHHYHKAENNSDSSPKLQSEKVEKKQDINRNNQSDPVTDADSQDISRHDSVKRRFADDESLTDASTEITNDDAQTKDMMADSTSAPKSSHTIEEFSTSAQYPDADMTVEEASQSSSSNSEERKTEETQSKVSPAATSHHVNKRRYAGRYDINNSDIKVKETDTKIPGAFYAGFWVRTAAYLFDLWMVGTINNILTNLVWTRFFGDKLDNGLMGFAIYMATYLIYFVLTNITLKGQTFGKVIFGLRTVSLNKEKLDLATILVREGFGRVIFHYLSFVMVTLVFTERKQHVVDMLCDTSVVNLRYIDALNEYLETSTHSQPVLAK